MHKMSTSLKYLAILFVLIMLLPACQTAFKAPMGDQDLEVDGDLDQDQDVNDADEDILQFNLNLSPDFLRVGSSIKNGEITFKNAAQLKEELAKGDPAFPNWRVDFGDDIRFDVIRFDAENLRFYDMEMVVWAKARTGKRTVSARITYGNVTVVEYGEFFVLPALDSRKKIKNPKK